MFWLQKKNQIQNTLYLQFLLHRLNFGMARRGVKFKRLALAPLGTQEFFKSIPPLMAAHKVRQQAHTHAGCGYDVWPRLTERQNQFFLNLNWGRWVSSVGAALCLSVAVCTADRARPAVWFRPNLSARCEWVPPPQPSLALNGAKFKAMYIIMRASVQRL